MKNSIINIIKTINSLGIYYSNKIKSEYLKSSFVTSIKTIVVILTGFLRNKFLIMFLGINAIGLYGQINQIFNTLNIFFGFISELGAVNLISKNKENKKNIKDIMGTFICLHLFFIIPFYISFYFINYNNLFLGISKYNNLLYIVLFSIPIYTIMYRISSIYFKSFLKYGKWAKFSIFINIANLLLLILATLLFSIKGIFFYFLFITIIYTISFLIFIHKDYGIFCFFNLSFKIKYIKIFFYYASKTIFGLLYVTIILNMRKIIIAEHGLAENAIFQAGYAISNYYLPLLTNGIWFYIFPKFSEKKLSFNEEKHIFLTTLKEMMILTTLITIIIIISTKYIILILYDSSMLKAITPIRVYTIVNILYLFNYLLSSILLAKQKLLIHNIINFLHTLLLYIIFKFFTQHKAIDLILTTLYIEIFQAILLFIYFFYINKRKNNNNISPNPKISPL